MQEWMESTLPPLVLAMLGGLADFLMSDEHSLSRMAIAMFLAGFTGYLTLLLCLEYQVSEAFTGVTCGVAGMSSKAVLQLFQKIFLDNIQQYIKSGKRRKYESREKTDRRDEPPVKGDKGRRYGRRAEDD